MYDKCLKYRGADFQRMDELCFKRRFLNITAEGLKEAAKAIADIIPTVTSIAARIVTFLAIGN
jgi:hypothetical protein